jgi:uncharacterized protein (TIGR03437 family)
VRHDFQSVSWSGPVCGNRACLWQRGAAVNILGTNLTGATSVSFNGTAATYIVLSSSKITTNVPAGNTAGEVKMVTSGGTLSSNVSFRVLP